MGNGTSIMNVHFYGEVYDIDDRHAARLGIQRGDRITSAQHVQLVEMSGDERFERVRRDYAEAPAAIAGLWRNRLGLSIVLAVAVGWVGFIVWLVL